ncbi:MAG: cyclodeaminase/cyclohydrolase family protein [Eubacteriaceae bacterium]|jgi:formiminotetrahydrofolate cyclodeaminase
MATMAEKTLKTFGEELYSKASVPGGGGAAALVGSIGVALGGMVGNLTTGKKKYAQYEDDIQRILKETKELQDSLLGMIDRDAENFRPLAKAYSLPSGTEEEKAHKAEVMEACTRQAVLVPIEICRAAWKGIVLQEELAVKGSMLALSDVGVGAVCLKAALQGGWLNIVINISSYKGSEWADAIDSEIRPLVESGSELAEKIYHQVEQKLAE